MTRWRELDGMMDNPYQAPLSTGTLALVPFPSRARLRAIADVQNAVLFFAPFEVLFAVILLVVPSGPKVYLTILMLIVHLNALVYLFRLACAVYGTGLGILLGILAINPVPGCLAFVLVSYRASSVLRGNGIKGGTLGADVSGI